MTLTVNEASSGIYTQGTDKTKKKRKKEEKKAKTSLPLPLERRDLPKLFYCIQRLDQSFNSTEFNVTS